MIVRKEWIKHRYPVRHISYCETYEYTGYFLFGVIPIYISRIKID